MILSLAPMEGLTGYVFRRVHAECFGGLDRYYTPFLSPKADVQFTKRERKDIDPANNAGIEVVPQLLTNDADAFIAGAKRLAELGYKEVNLNLGCPSGTVVSKGKGSGFLKHPQELEAFLMRVCGQSPIPVSVKTRLGLIDDAEYDALLDLYCRCPLAELIVHPRVQKDMYRGAPRRQAYGQALQKTPFPVAYNGDIFSIEDLEALTGAFPETQHVMIGRGILANPALARMARGGSSASLQELGHFHDRLFAEYQDVMGANAVSRMKEWWFYAKHSFADPLAVKRLVRKARTVDDYLTAASCVFREQKLAARPTRPIS